MRVQKVHYDGPRIKTGPLQLGGDWPGYFIRGDDAGGLIDKLSAAVRELEKCQTDKPTEE